MATFIIRSFVITVCVLLATVAGSSVEIFDGTYYGIDEDQNGEIRVQVSGPQVSTASNSSQTVIGDLESQSELPVIDVDQLPRQHGHHRRGPHHRGRHGHHRHNGDGEQGHMYHSGRFSHMRHNWSDEERLNHVCTKLQAFIRNNTNGDASRHGRHHGMMSWKLQMLSEQNRQTVMDMWNRRKQDMMLCCSKSSTAEKMECAEKMREARYDRVCRGEEPLCPWALFMSDTGRHRQRHVEPTGSTSNTTAVCCQLQGSERIQCFTTARDEYRRRMHGRSERGRMHVMHSQSNDQRPSSSSTVLPEAHVDSRRQSRRHFKKPRRDGSA